jgi:hypothetical protein
MGTRLTIPIARYSAFRPNECVKFVADYDDEWAKSFEYTILEKKKKSAGWMINWLFPTCCDYSWKRKLSKSRAFKWRH